MWSRASLKNKAKTALKGNYWQAFLVSLILLITGGSHNQGAGGGGRGPGNAVYEISSELNFQLITFIGMIILVIIILRLLIGYVLEVGGRRFFIQTAEGNSKMSDLAFGFKNGNYFDIFFTMILRSIYLILWTLLFIIPGIIKFYAYRMVPYILANNPRIGYNKAIKLSNKMTKGEKFAIFILDLSFIGWYILGALTFGIGVFFVQPYYDATNAELYLKLREKAINQGIVTPEELNLT